MSREAILGRIRQHLHRTSESPMPAPEVRLVEPDVPLEEKIGAFTSALKALAATVFRAASSVQARDYITELIDDREAIASNAQLLSELGITALENVRSEHANPQALRAACASAAVGISGADYALADTGSLVVLSSPAEARLVSLLPPVHVAVVKASRILTGLDELLRLLPLPADQTSSMVFITGPSRTADIEQILVRGVHGPGQLHVVIV